MAPESTVDSVTHSLAGAGLMVAEVLAAVPKAPREKKEKAPKEPKEKKEKPSQEKKADADGDSEWRMLTVRCSLGTHHGRLCCGASHV